MNLKVLALGALAALGVSVAYTQVVLPPGVPLSGVIACAFNTVPPTLTNGQAGIAQCDNAGKLIVSGGGGGGGGAVTIADGADTAQGTTTDAACATDNGTCTEIALLKRENQRLTTLITATGTPFQAGGSIGNAGFTSTPVATEVHLGEVGGNILPITNTMTTSASTGYVTGRSIGGLQTLANSVRVSGALGASGTSGIIQSVLLTFKDAIGSVPVDVYYFNANPTGSTCTDNTAFALADADRDKTIFIAHVTDFTASNVAAIGQAGNAAIPFGLASATSMFACVVARGTVTTGTGTANASLITRVLRN